MVAYVFVIGVLNFGLGFALAAWQDRSRAREPSPDEAAADASATGATARIAPAPPPASLPDAAETEASPGEEEVSAADFQDDEVPVPPADPAWAEALDAAFGPALALEIADYRRRLMTIEQLARACPGAAALRDLLADFQRLNESWRAAAVSACEPLERQRGRLADFDGWAERLATALRRLDQALGTALTLPTLDPADEESSRAACRRLTVEVDRLLKEVHLFRDQRYEAQAALLGETGRLALAPHEELVDVQTQLHNRLGLEAVFRQWRRDHPQRPWAVAVLDIDQFQDLNERLGMVRGDRLLAALGGLTDELLRKDRGFDRAGRRGADSFALFLGDTDQERAIEAVERIRQTVEACSFEEGDDSLALTVSAGVACGGAPTGEGKNPLADALQRADQAAQAAKKHGGNCTCSFGSTCVKLESTRPYEVRRRVIHLTSQVPTP